MRLVINGPRILGRTGSRGEARHQSVEALPLKPSRARDLGSETSPNRKAAPLSRSALPVGVSVPPTPERGRTKHTTS